MKEQLYSALIKIDASSLQGSAHDIQTFITRFSSTSETDMSLFFHTPIQLRDKYTGNEVSPYLLVEIQVDNQTAAGEIADKLTRELTLNDVQLIDKYWILKTKPFSSSQHYAQQADCVSYFVEYIGDVAELTSWQNHYQTHH